MRAVALPWRLGYEVMANGCSMWHVPCRGATRWSILPSWVYPVEVLHHPLGSKGEPHVLASSSSSSSKQATGGPKVLATTRWVKTGSK